MKNPKINLHKSVDGQYFYTITAKNGEVLTVSETMTQKHNAKSGALGLIKAAVLIWFGLKCGKQVIDDQTGE